MNLSPASQKVFVVALVAMCATSCGRYEETAVMTEPGVVQTLVYSPANHSTGIGMSMSGNMVMTSNSTPEVHGVVFQCEHGNFFKRSRPLFMRLRVGQRVTLHYRETYWVSEDGRERALHDRDLVDAVPLEHDPSEESR